MQEDTVPSDSASFDLYPVLCWSAIGPVLVLIFILYCGLLFTPKPPKWFSKVMEDQDQDQDLTGKRVIVTGLASRPELNGRVGIARIFDSRAAPQGRYVVELDHGETKCFKLQRQNLTLCKDQCPATTPDQSPEVATREAGAPGDETGAPGEPGDVGGAESRGARGGGDMDRHKPTPADAVHDGLPSSASPSPSTSTGSSISGGGASGKGGKKSKGQSANKLPVTIPAMSPASDNL